MTLTTFNLETSEVYHSFSISKELIYTPEIKRAIELLNKYPYISLIVGSFKGSVLTDEEIIGFKLSR